MLFVVFLSQHTYMHVPASSEACRGYRHGADEHAHEELVASLASYLGPPNLVSAMHGGLLCRMRLVMSLWDSVYVCP